ncbi:MAG: hypothetical protein GY723_07510, partial [bacterium]|nr:hypothetical protein [bacterium]
RALATCLLGSVDSQLPEFFHHNPSGHAKEIEAGWWVVNKYHCIGCHQIVPGQTPDVRKLPQYRIGISAESGLYEEEGREKVPPSLVGTGARIGADWQVAFLRNPALSDTKPHRNGVRMHLDIRMPTYSVSEEEIGALVRLLNALSKQPSPYPVEKLTPLGKDELADARALFQAAKCSSCHVTSDDPSTFTSETKAPSFMAGVERLRSRWTRRWLRNPNRVIPGTVMPVFFTEVDGQWRTSVLS